MSWLGFGKKVKDLVSPPKDDESAPPTGGGSALPTGSESAKPLASAGSHASKGEDRATTKALTEALQAFQNGGTQRGAVDTLSAIIDACNEEGSLDQADEMAARLQKEGDAVGVAKMKLLRAEVICAKQAYDQQAEALALATEARASFQSEGAKQLEAAALLATTNVLNMTKGSCWTGAEKALEAAKQARELFQEVGDHMGEGKSLHGLAVALFTGRTSSSCGDWLMTAREALELARASHDKKAEAAELQCIASFHLLQGNLTAALQSAREALSIWRGLDEGKFREALPLEYIAQSHLLMGHAMEAFKAVQDGMKCFTEAKEKRGQAAMHSLLVSVNLALEDFAGASRAADAALAIYRDELQDVRGQSKVMRLQTMLLLGQQEFQQAVRTAEVSMSMLQKFGDQKETAYSLQSLAAAYLQSGQPDNAVRVGEELRSHFKSTGSGLAEAVSLLVICSAHQMSGNLEESAASAREAQALFDKGNDVPGQAQAFLRLSEVQGSGAKWMASKVSAEKARRLFKRAGAEREEAQALLTENKANIELLLKKVRSPSHEAWEEAMRNSQEVLRFAEALRDQGLGADALMQAARVHLTTGNQDEALWAAGTAGSLYAEAGRMGEVVSAMILSAEIRAKEGAMTDMQKLVDQAREMASGVGDATVEAKLDKMLQGASARQPASAKAPAIQHKEGKDLAESAGLVRTTAGSVVDVRSGMSLELLKLKVLDSRQLILSYCRDDLESDTPLMQGGICSPVTR